MLLLRYSRRLCAVVILPHESKTKPEEKNLTSGFTHEEDSATLGSDMSDLWGLPGGCLKRQPLLLFHVSARVIKFLSYANDKVMMITFSRPYGLERIPQKGGGLNVEWKTKRNGKLTVKILRGFPLFSCHLPCSLLKSAHEDFHFSVFIGHRKIGESTW